ncbi:MAG: FAD-binding oxidoreductase [Acidimicrobiia bacterium]|nr:FAD-binding oxidoreductase [Acidimicrobiia bacterium]
MATADFVIVGGGIVGVSIAAALAREGLDVVLVEQGRIGAAASGRSQGLLVPPDDPALAPFFSRTTEIVARLASSGPDDCDFDTAPIEAMLVALDHSSLEALEEAAASFQMAHVAVQRIGADDAVAIEPQLSHEVRAGLTVPEVRRVSADAVTAGLARVATERGADIRTGEAVRRVLLDRAASVPRVSGIATDLDVIETACVVDAAGPWARLVSRTVGRDLRVAGVRGWILVTEPLDTGMRSVVIEAGFTHAAGGFGPHRLPTVGSLAQSEGATGEGPPSIAALIVPDGVGGVVLGATEASSISDSPSGAEAVGLIARRAARVVPTLAGTSVAWSWSGLRPVTPDERPLLGPLPGIDGFWVAAGHGSRGISTGPASGEAVAAALCGADPGVDLTPFAPGRFDVPVLV